MTKKKVAALAPIPAAIISVVLGVAMSQMSIVRALGLGVVIYLMAFGGVYWILRQGQNNESK